MPLMMKDRDKDDWDKALADGSQWQLISHLLVLFEEKTCCTNGFHRGNTQENTNPPPTETLAVWCAAAM